jgi:hypothetical protein
MSLISLIEAVPNWDTKTAQQVYDELNAATVPYSDPQMWTWAGVALVAGPEGAEGLRLSLEANNMGWAVHQLGGSGLQLSNDQVQGALLAFAAGGVPNMTLLATTVKRKISKLEQAGITTTVSEVGLLKLKQAKLDAATNRLQAYREALSSWDGSGEGPVL